MTATEAILEWGTGLLALAEMNDAELVTMRLRDGTTTVYRVGRGLTVKVAGETIEVPEAALEQRWGLTDLGRAVESIGPEPGP